MKKIAVFISGAGSNAARMVREFKGHPVIDITYIVSTRENQAIAELCEESGVTFVPTEWSEKEQEELLSFLKEKKIDWIVLAGFLKLIPKAFVESYEKKIINLHPALLPKFGGKGMYGMNVHRAVIESGEKESGISIHYVNSNYDEGELIDQFSVEVTPSDDEHSLFEKIRKLEVEHFTKTVEREILETL